MGLPEQYTVGVRPGSCVSISSQVTPLYVSFFTQNNMTVTALNNGLPLGNSMILYGPLSSIAPITRFDTLMEYQFHAIETSFVTITIASFDAYDCEKIYIEPQNNKSFSFSKNSDGFFSLPIKKKLCFFYTAPATQTVIGNFGKCQNCPKVEIYSGQYRYKILNSNQDFEFTQESSKFPTFLVFTPSNTSDDLSSFSFTVSTNSPASNYTGREYFAQPKILPRQIPNHKGNIYAVCFSVFFIITCTCLICLMFCNFRKKPSKAENPLLPSEDGLETPYPFTTTANYRKHMQKYTSDEASPVLY